MNCCDDYGKCTQGNNCPVRVNAEPAVKSVWPFPATPLPNDRTRPPFNPNNHEDALL